MKIIELTDIQFKNYAKIHSARNYMQTTEYASTIKNYSRLYLGFINENDNTLMGATLLLEREILKFKVGYVPGCFLIDYDNLELLREGHFVGIKMDTDGVIKDSFKVDDGFVWNETGVKIWGEFGMIIIFRNKKAVS